MTDLLTEQFLQFAENIEALTGAAVEHRGQNILELQVGVELLGRHEIAEKGLHSLQGQGLQGHRTDLASGNDAAMSALDA